MILRFSNSVFNFEKSCNISTHLHQTPTTNYYKHIKYGIWIYFILLIFEGALRKWVVPQLSTPILIIRDPIALYILINAWYRGLLPSNIYLNTSITIGIISFFTALILGHGNLYVALFGARIFLLHFPLVFVIGKVFNRDDVIKLGKVLVWLAIPMVILIAFQFYSPQTAWVNKGVGGEGGGGFSGALGYFRPPGTFSFIGGATSFFSMVAPFILFFWVNPQKPKLLILIAGTISLLAAVPLSISRGLFGNILLSIFFLIIASAKDAKYVGKIIISILTITVSLLFLSKFEFFQTSLEAFISRFEIANKAEGGVDGIIIDRVLGGLIKALTSSNEQPFFGYGLGLGTNAGGAILTGKSTMLISEGEWGRIIGEIGPLMGLGIIFLRVSLTLNLVKISFNKIKEGNLLPWMLTSNGIMLISQGQWAPPYSLGFSTLIAGLIIASINKPITEN